jgi:hypothetical protein
MKSLFLTFAGLLFVNLLVIGCSSESDQAERYYEMDKYEAALNVANKILAKDKDNAEMAVLVWKIQVAGQFCDDEHSVEMACSLIREKAKPFGSRIIAPLKEGLQEERGCVQLMAVYTLGNIDDPQVYPILSEVAEGKGADVRKRGSITKEVVQGAALVTLGQRGNKEAYPLMLDAARSQSGVLRAKAAEALGYIGDERTVTFLEGLLKDKYTVGGKRPVAIAASRSLKMITGKDYPVD